MTQGYSFNIVSGNNQQTTPLNSPFAAPLVVSLVPNYAGDPVAGAIVTFTAPHSGASATFGKTSVTIGSNLTRPR